MPDDEHIRKINEWNSTAVNYSLEKSVHQLFEEQALRSPDCIAVVFEDQVLTYAELDSRANKLAHYLISNGIRSGDFVGVYMDRSLELVIALIGILKTGAAYVPIDPSYPVDRRSYILEMSTASALITQDHLLKNLKSNPCQIICLDKEWASINHQPDNKPNVKYTPDDLICVLFTSGSTGKPKGVMCVHRGMTNRILWMQDAYKLEKDDVVLQKTPIGFDVSGWEFYWPLITGCKLIMARPEGHKDPSYLIKVINKHAVTTLHFVPPMLQAFISTEGFESCKSIRRIICSGDILHIETQRKVFSSLNCELHNLYGPTEASIDVTAWKCCLEYDGASIPIGKPIANTQMHILDKEMNPLSIGVPGELYIGGVQLARGYFNRPDLTEERFVQNPLSDSQLLYKTGDLARYLPDGNIEFMGRLDHQVKIRGVRIELGEIETVLDAHPNIKECVVVAREDRPGEKYLVAYLVADSGMVATKNLREFLAQSLSDAMIPSYFVVLKELPISPNGKIDRQKLPAPTNEIGNSDSAYIAPRNSVETTLSKIWIEILHLDKVGIHDNFFEIGGDSIKATALTEKIKKNLNVDISVIDIFENYCISKLAAMISQGGQDIHTLLASNKSKVQKKDTIDNRRDIAVIGISCEFPGADNLQEFWKNVCDGKESIFEIDDESLISEGISKNDIDNPNYVKRRPFLKNIKTFDPGFFGYSDRDAATMDPQHRKFLEHSWKALEDSAYVPEKYNGRIGVFAGCDNSFYLQNNVGKAAVSYEVLEDIQLMINNLGEYLASKVAYKLNLNGPAINIQTACSTSLVAVHLACQSILSGDSDIALAGGVSIRVPHKVGYAYKSDLMLSKDGSCRAFDADAEGTPFGHGIGIIVLKTLHHAQKDGDHIYAVIKGSAINNDGAQKVGFTAPSVLGQKDVIKKALGNSVVTADTIGYVEAHGTATKLGDPIEFKALEQAFRSETHKTAFCALGSVKTNIGHLAQAAGMAGIIKAIMALHCKVIPPSLNFEKPNKEIALKESPFYVPQKASSWVAEDIKRRAGVSAFGFGGTNAHVILEEAPKSAVSQSNRQTFIYPFSAKSAGSLRKALSDFGSFLVNSENGSLPDIAYSLQQGRAEFDYRCAFTASSKEKILSEINSKNLKIEKRGNGRVVYVFSGQGGKYINAGKDLYLHEPVFKEAIDFCAGLFLQGHGIEILKNLYPENDTATTSLPPIITQPIIFSIQYALIKLWESWGVTPDKVVGHSLGEYAAAYVAGVVSIKDVIDLIAVRAKLSSDIQEGSMLAVQATEEKLISMPMNGVEIASVNSENSRVFSGDNADIEFFAMNLDKESIPYIRLNTDRAYHSRFFEEASYELGRQARKVTLEKPKLPWYSTVTGDLVSDDQAVSPDYWQKNLRNQVLFDKALSGMIDDNAVFLEIGPEQVLSSLISKKIRNLKGSRYCSSLPGSMSSETDEPHIYQTVTKLWLHGVNINWEFFNANCNLNKVSLPTYQFERQEFWIDRTNILSASKPDKDLSNNSLYTPWWKPRFNHKEIKDKSDTWIVFLDPSSQAEKFITRLEYAGNKVVSVKANSSLQGLIRHDSNNYELNPQHKDSYFELLSLYSGYQNISVVHFGNFKPADSKAETDDAEEIYSSLLYLTQAIADQDISKKHLTIVCDGLLSLDRDKNIQAEKAVILGIARCAIKEIKDFYSRCVDIRASNLDDEIEALIELSNDRLTTGGIILRNGRVYEQDFSSIEYQEHEKSPLGIREGGVYLITGGSGGIAQYITRYIMSYRNAKVVLVSRSFSDEKIKADDREEGILRISADLSDKECLKKAIQQAEMQFGKINGVFHAAGVSGSTLIRNKTREQVNSVFRPKIHGTINLAEIFKDKDIDFLIAFSSISSIFPDLGQSDYAAANAFIDSFADLEHKWPFLAINWDTWEKTGMAAKYTLQLSLHEGEHAATLSPEKGIAALDKSLHFAKIYNQIIVCPSNIQDRKRAFIESDIFSKNLPSNENIKIQNFPNISPVERDLLEAWVGILGREPEDLDQSFFEMGGDSLSAIQYLTALKETHNYSIGIKIFFENSNIKKLSQFLNQGSAETGLSGNGTTEKAKIIRL